MTEKKKFLQDPKISRKDTHPVGKGTRPALISTSPLSHQFILKESQNSDFSPPPPNFGRL